MQRSHLSAASATGALLLTLALAAASPAPANSMTAPGTRLGAAELDARPPGPWPGALHDIPAVVPSAPGLDGPRQGDAAERGEPGMPGLTPRAAAKLDPRLRLLYARLGTRAAAPDGRQTKTAARLPRLERHPGIEAPDIAWRPLPSTPDAALRVIVETSDPRALSSAGADIRAYGNGLAAAVLRAGDLAAAASAPGTKRVRLAASLEPLNDIGRTDARIASAEADYGVDGRGVTVIVIDSGIDFTHGSFLDADGRTRIKGLLDLSDPGDLDCDGRLDGEGPGGGTLHTQSEIDRALASIASGEARAYDWPREPTRIPDSGTLKAALVVPAADATPIETLAVRVEVEHAYIGDVSLSLVAPNGRRHVLLRRAKPGADSLHAFYEVHGLQGSTTEGEWTLEVGDEEAGDIGYLLGWSLLANRVVRHQDLVGHGTHVAGTAAGDDAPTGASSPGAFAGAAPAADLVVVAASRTMGGSYWEDDLMAALQWADTYGQSLGQPYVVNVSLGAHSGARDGSGPVERFIDGLFGDGREGRALVVAAGNDGERNSHAGGTFSRDDDAIALAFPDEALIEQLEIWFEGPTTTRLGLALPPGVQCKTSDLDGRGLRSDCGGMQLRPGDAKFVWLLTPDDEVISLGLLEWSPKEAANQMYRVLFLLLAAYDYIPEGPWQMRFQGGSGAWSAWATVGEPFGSHGDNRVTISNLASAHNVIAVGSHTTKLAWTDILGRRHTEDGALQALSAYSSRGPTRDGRPKPDLTAPGEWIVSARSLTAAWPMEWVTSRAHVAAAGTSMSAPLVSGTVALMLSLPECAEMDANALRDLLTGAAHRDEYTGADRNDDWGAGKLDAHAALALAGASSSDPATATPTATSTPVTPPGREPTSSAPTPMPTREISGGTATLFLPIARR